MKISVTCQVSWWNISAHLDNICDRFQFSCINTKSFNISSLKGIPWTWYRIKCSYHVTHAFQSESTLCSCLNVKELLAQNRRQIWSLSDCSWTRTHNHLVHKRTLNHWLNGWVLVYELSGCEFESVCSHYDIE